MRIDSAHRSTYKKIMVFLLVLFIIISIAGNIFAKKNNEEARRMLEEVNANLARMEELVSRDKDMPLKWQIVELEKENNMLRERIIVLEDALSEKR